MLLNYIFVLTIALTTLGLFVYGGFRIGTCLTAIVGAWASFTLLTLDNDQLMFYIWCFFTALSISDINQAAKIGILRNEQKAKQQTIDPDAFKRAVDDFCRDDKPSE